MLNRKPKGIVAPTLFAVVSVRMPVKLHAVVSALAKQDRRAVSEWIRLVIEDAVTARKPE